jgi:threonine dehydrogenase-like Zn-dependent dehydrogenase
VDKIPLAALIKKGLTVMTGQTHVKCWSDELLYRIKQGQFDPLLIIAHRTFLRLGPAMYKRFRDKRQMRQRGHDT